MGRRLDDLLEESARLYPEKIAVTYKQEARTYRQIDELSSQLAACLIKNGVRPSSRVGVYLDKSIDALIAIFGILKSGACYVPLDPFSPAHRIGLIIQDCALERVVTSSKKVFDLKLLLKGVRLECLFFIDTRRRDCAHKFSQVRTVFKDEIAQAPARVGKIRRDQGKDLAYILYTSGSTGTPKGVMITHRASLAFVDWASGYLQVSRNDHLSAQAPFHFDLSVFDIYAAFKAGATLHIVPTGISAFPESLAEFIENKKISIWYSVPSVLIQLLLYGGLANKEFPSLKKIVFAGEVFPVKYLRALMRIIPAARYYNFYGPTEANVCAAYRVGMMPKDDKPIPIGKPCTGQKFFILDAAGRLSKNGDLGELYLSGPTLMEGYWNDAQKTKSALLNKFPYAKGMVYRTGDFVIRRKNGNFEYRGRRDGLIKIKGYRVEPGEIEAALLAHEKVKEATVIGASGGKTGKKLKAFIVPKKSETVTESQIRSFCLKRLPLYMVPESIVFKKGLPRLSTGKIDRKKFEPEPA